MSKRRSREYGSGYDLSRQGTNNYNDDASTDTNHKHKQNKKANKNTNSLRNKNSKGHKKSSNKNKNKTVNVKEIIQEQKTYYSLDIEINTDMVTLDEIIAYIKREWPAYKKLYNYCIWSTYDNDMTQLSEMFMDCKFTLYCKGEFFIDAYFIKVYTNGIVKHLDCHVKCQVSIMLPDNSIRQTNGQGIIMLENEMDKILCPKDRKINVSIKEQISIATDLLVLLGQNVVSVGMAFSETLLASKLISSCLSIVDALHQDYTKYGDNKGKCYNLNLRCKNILNTLQSIPAYTLNLGPVINVVNCVRDALDLINEYNGKWRITRFFNASRYQDVFNEVNTNLSNFYYDFGINYSVNRKAFEIVGDSKVGNDDSGIVVSPSSGFGNVDSV